MMRVIAGTARRIGLEVADGSRPFLEMARGALFNSLAPLLPGAAVLDLYSGSGALGIEALSRGAASCVFVELDAAAFRALGNNVRRCGFGRRARLLRGDAAEVAAGLDGAFGLVFVDPPFPDAAGWAAGGGGLELARAAAGLLAPEGVLVFRVEGVLPAPPEWGGLVLLRENRYGRSRVCRYRAARAKEEVFP